MSVLKDDDSEEESEECKGRTGVSRVAKMVSSRKKQRNENRVLKLSKSALRRRGD